MKIFGFLLIIVSSVVLVQTESSIYDFKIQALDSEEVIDFQSFKGKKVLLVNVASKCGYTGQYADLEKLYQTFQDQLVIVGFPCNQFLGQEPGSEEEIAQFCSSNYGVTFPMTTKIDVKGKAQHEIYKWLTNKELNEKDDYKVKWNFNKFLIDENGQLIDHYPSKVKPFDGAITKHLGLNN